MKDKIVCILSGGLDSTTLLYYLIDCGYNVYTISFNYGQKHNKELNCASKTCKKLGISHKVVDISLIKSILDRSVLIGCVKVPEGHYEDESMRQTIVPNRNMLFLSLAIAYAINIGAGEVFYGAHKGDAIAYPDCRPIFVNAMKRVARICDYRPIKISTPFINMSKSTIVKWGIILGVDYSLTWSCYNGHSKACGKCSTCLERLESFKKNKIEDPIEYEV